MSAMFEMVLIATIFMMVAIVPLQPLSAYASVEFIM